MLVDVTAANSQLLSLARAGCSCVFPETNRGSSIGSSGTERVLFLFCFL